MSDFEFDAIMARLYSQLGIEKDVQLADVAGVAKNTISTWKKRKQVPFDVIARLAQRYNFSVDYILFGKTQTILDDFIGLLGKEEAKKELHRHLVFFTLEKFKKQNLGIYKILGSLLGNGLYARPLLFLYYILSHAQAIIEEKETQNPKKILVDALHATHFSRWTFGPEMSQARLKKYEEYILYQMSDEEAKIVVHDIPVTLQVLEAMMPSTMVWAHRKDLQAKKK